MKWHFITLESMATRLGLILERENKGYSLTDNSRGTTAICKNLNEVAIELYGFMNTKRL